MSSVASPSFAMAATKLKPAAPERSAVTSTFTFTGTNLLLGGHSTAGSAEHATCSGGGSQRTAWTNGVGALEVVLKPTTWHRALMLLAVLPRKPRVPRACMPVPASHRKAWNGHAKRQLSAIVLLTPTTW